MTSWISPTGSKFNFLVSWISFCINFEEFKTNGGSDG
jgi:hypothetical protein